MINTAFSFACKQNLRSGIHIERSPVPGVVDGGNGPGDADTEEHVDGITTGDVTDTGVGVLVLNGSDLTGERV